MEKKEIKRSLVPTFHQICSMHQNHPSSHGDLHLANPLLLIFLHTQIRVQTTKKHQVRKNNNRHFNITSIREEHKQELLVLLGSCSRSHLVAADAFHIQQIKNHIAKK
jgi:hypothetical protein